MLEQSCNEFITDLASSSPVPGGGGASALVGAVGMALGSMVGNLTLGRKKYAEVEPEIKQLLLKSAEITEQLKLLVSRDAEAFQPLSRAYGLPQTTEAEKLEREKIMQAALIEAVQPPMEIARVCLQAIELQAEYARIGTRIAISDVGVGAAFCKAALQGAALNVFINTKLLKDTAVRQALEQEITELVARGSEQADLIYATVEAQLH
ncbi:MAG: cyclodeaminase/cyclohydrolase family protein [Saccharofermentanales bacterium]|jgi:formiminotetrahydrofolate cyclodeaminase